MSHIFAMLRVLKPMVLSPAPCIFPALTPAVHSIPPQATTLALGNTHSAALLIPDEDSDGTHNLYTFGLGAHPLSMTFFVRRSGFFVGDT